MKRRLKSPDPGRIANLPAETSAIATSHPCLGPASPRKPLSPPFALVQRRLQGSPAKSKFLAVAVVLGSLSAVSAQGLYYHLETVAESGTVNNFGETIQSFRDSSINESGIVAMSIILETGANDVQQIHISGTGSIPTALGPVTAGDNRRTGFASINSQGKILAWEGFLFGSPRPSQIRIWDAANPTQIPGPTVRNLDSKFDAILTPPSIANDGGVFFPALSPRCLHYIAPGGNAGTAQSLTNIGPGAGIWGADGGSYVFRNGAGAGGTLSAKINGSTLTIASAGSASFGEIGTAPGISSNGKLVAFAANVPGEGPGIFLYVDEPADANFDSPVRIMGFGDERDGLGYGDNGSSVVFSDFDLNQRVAVEHREKGETGIEDDEIIVSFIATPNGNSVSNPQSGDPLLFTNNPGLWVVHLTPSRDLKRTQPLRMDVKTSPMPVVQVGQVINGQAVTEIKVWDQLAFAEKSVATGSARVTIGPADHYLAFEVVTTSGRSSILRATQLDSDFDGLFDHWEVPSGGIDINLDGTVDLRLSDFGVTPLRKDALFEIDWSIPWAPEPFTDQNGNRAYDFGEPYDDQDENGVFTYSTYEPHPAALQKIADSFNNAPVPNPVGPDGITARIDAGPGRSINMPGTANLQGGDLIDEPGTARMIHMIYPTDRLFDTSNPGTIEPYNLPFVAVSAKTMRDSFFGTVENNARELAFRHIAFCNKIGIEKFGDATGLAESPLFALRTLEEGDDYFDNDHNCKYSYGDYFNDTDGDGSYDVGEAFIDPDGDGYTPPERLTSDTNGNGIYDFEKLESYRSMPGNSIILGLEGIADNLTVSGTISVPFPNAGAPNEISPSPGFFHYQILYHEIGHLLTLNHGGDDGTTSFTRPTIKPNYRSIMNYAYTELPDSNGTIIDNYSGTEGPGTFNDWSIVKLDFCRYFDTITSDLRQSRYAPGVQPNEHVELSPHRDLADIESILGPLGPVERAIGLRGSTTISPDLVDADGDGLVFLMEDALGLNPNIRDAYPSPLTHGVRWETANPVSFFRYPRDTTKNIDYIVERSDNLDDWFTTGLSEAILSTAAGIELVEVTFPLVIPGEIYFRLRVSRQP